MPVCTILHRVIWSAPLHRFLIQNFSLYLALRYLRPKRTFVSVITVISVLGVSFGVWALIVVISVMAGFHDQIKKLSMDFDSHILAQDRWGNSMFSTAMKRPEDSREKTWHEVAEAIKKVPGVTSATPQVHGLILVETKDGTIPRVMWGLDSGDNNRMLTKQKEMIIEGELDLSGDGIILDESFARSYHTRVGDTVTVYAPSNMTDLVRALHDAEKKPKGPEREAAYNEVSKLVLPQELKVTGIYSPPKLQDMSDVRTVLVPLHVARELNQMGDGISSLGIEVDNPYEAGQVKKAMKESGALPAENWTAATWMEQHKALFDTVQNELEMMYFILSMIVVVAAFCVMNTMITVTVQKRREIGIISALGSRIGQIMWVFLYQGMIVGLFGAGLGLGMGLFTVHYRNTIRAGIAWCTGHEIFDSSIYGLIEIPAKVLPHDVAIICGGAFVLCTLAALVPAWLAARTEPAVALRD